LAKIRVLIGDKQPAFWQGLTRLLAETQDIEVAGLCADGEELLALCQALQPDVAIIDMALPKINAIDACKKLKSISPNTATLIVSVFYSQTLALSALRAGAAAFLTKDTSHQDLIKAIRLTNVGQGIIENGVRENSEMNSSVGKEPRQGLDLNPRELEVLKLTANGLRNKEIAQELNISGRTVQAHLSNIFSKLEVGSRSEAVLKALKSGWLDIGDLR
jgi:DNA-binding NarL/FixJ family response regulator